MSDIIQDIRDYFSDRFSSPLWMSIIVSWLLFNWQLPITAIFETAKFNVDYILNYQKNTTHWCLITIPILSGLTYSILSSSAKETLELLSKTIRNLITKIDRNGIFYRSISITEHEKQLLRLKRQLQRMESDKELLNETAIENTKLTEEKTNLTNKLNSIILEAEKHKNEHNQTLKKNNDLEDKLSTTNILIETLTNNKNDLSAEKASLLENLTNEKELRENLEKIKSKFIEQINEANQLKEKHKKITHLLKKYTAAYQENIPDTTKKLINDLEKNGISLTENKEISIKIENTYYETVYENCDEQQKEELKNPHSSASIFLIFDVLSKSTYYTQQEIQTEPGFPEHEFEKTFKTVIDAQWVTQNNVRQYVLTDTGNIKLNELNKIMDQSKLKRILFEINKETEKHIISILMENHLSFDTLKKKIYFNYDIRTALKNLFNQGKIKQSGTVFYYKK